MPDAEKDARAQCAHCGQTLPHEGTGWRETYRCRMFQSIAEQGWDEGYTSGHSNAMRRMSDEPNAPTTPNPYRILPPGKPESPAQSED